MPRSGWLLLVCACAAGAAVGAVPRPPADAIVRGALDLVPADDPFPIRRVRGTEARLPELLKELEPGPVTRMPRAEFESRVRAAGRAGLLSKTGARVADATYTAELDGADLTGSAQLGVLNANGTSGFLPLDPLRLAVRGAKWLNGGEALVVVPPGATAPAVWASGEGRRVLQFQWSLAGTTEPGEQRFELRVPPCASSVLELSLPTERVPTAPAEVLLTGPFEVSGRPDRRAWRFRFGGRSKLEFAVRAGGAPSVGATAALVAKYELDSGQLAAAFEYELRPARGSVGEWTFTADPGLWITEVVANNRAGWTFEPPLTPNGPRRVRVSLRQPGPGGKVLINAVGAFPDPARPANAPLPVVRPVGAVMESETVELRLAPGLKIVGWAPGDYYLTDASTAADQARVLALTGALLQPGSEDPFRRMPALRTVAPESEFTTFERLEWAPGPARSSLVARVRVGVVRGPLFRLTVRPPSGLQLDSRAAASDEQLAFIGAPVGGNQVVELARPLLTGQHAELRFEFHGAGVKFDEPVPFPVFAVPGATEREGWLSVATDPACAVTARPGAGARPAGLWGWLTTDAPRDARALYLFRAKEPDGSLVLAPARPKVRAEAVVSLGAPGDRGSVVTRLTLTLTGGVLPTGAVFVPGARDTERTWKLLDPSNAVAAATPVPPELLALAPLFSPADVRAGLVGARARESAHGTVWVLRFARPLVGTVVLETTAPGTDLATVPVPRFLGAEQTTRAEVAAFSDRMAEVVGDEVRVGPRPRLTLGAAPVSEAYLLTAVRAPDEVIAAFGGTVRGSPGGVLPIGLPSGAEVRGVCVAGRWLNPAACGARGSDEPLRVPIPAGPPVRFEVRYRLPAATGWPTRRVSSPVPTVPGDPHTRRWWSFAAGTLPGWPARPWNATDDRPPLLGGPLASGPEALVTLSDDDWVRVGSTRAADALAVGLVALLVAFGLRAARSHTRGGLALAGFVVLGVGVAEFGPPWWARVAWPVLCASVLALARVLVGFGLRPRRAPALATALVLVCALGSFQALAQPFAPATVFIVPGADGAEEVIAPRALVDQLDALARPPLPVPVVTAASYEVRAEETGARVAARFVVHAFRESDNVVSLPLSDTRLEKVTVNGAVAFPTAPRPDTYALALGGPGRYEVEVLFAATVTATGPERDLRFGVPEVADAQLSASLTGAARQPQLVGRFGRQSVGAANDRTTLAADLGAAKSVHLRWREGAGGAAVMTVREGCVWDVTDTGAELTCAYFVRVEQGTVPGLRFEVPAELDVLRVAVRSTEVPAAPVALKDWSLVPDNGAFRLRLDFQGPTTGRFLVVLECAPRKPLSRQPVLRFPKVAFGTVKGGTEAVYGLRATRVDGSEVERSGVLDFSPDALRDFAAVPDLKLDPNQPVLAYRLVAGATAELRPKLRVLDAPAVRTTTNWRVGPHRADASGTISWAARSPVAFVQFALAGAEVLEVRGPDVVGWSREGTRVQVWLRTGAKEGAIEWTGTVTPVPPGKLVTEPLYFEPAPPKVAFGRVTLDEVRVRPIEGWTVGKDRSRGWDTTGGDTDLRFRTDSPTAQGLRVQLAPRPPTR